MILYSKQKTIMLSYLNKIVIKTISHIGVGRYWP